ncbi:MAG: rhomboid family intramembrane serine protease [Sphingomonadales bacterium]|nr:MAG: rhomboid family intramembrane serine protease [Sphingomonadales bacterium]
MMNFKPPRPVRTPVTQGLAICCLLVFAAQWLGGPEFDFAASQRGGLIPALLLGVQANEALHNWRVATLLTALFLHASWLHLGANMLMLLVVGRPVEWVLGSLWTLVLYILSGIAGGLLQAFADPTSMIPVIGASGAIAGLFGGYAMLFSREKVASRTLLGVWVSGRLLRVLWIAATWIGLQLLLDFSSGGNSLVAIWAHIGGFLAGLVLTPPMLRAVSARVASPGD